MNQQPITLQDLDEFLDDTFKADTQELQSDLSLNNDETVTELAWQAAQAFQANLLEFGLYEETLYFKAAATGDELDLPFQLDSIGGEWIIVREIIPGDDEWQILKFRCTRTPEIMDLYEQRQITAVIGGQNYDLGEVFECVAEATIPRNINLSQGITIKLGEKVL